MRPAVFCAPIRLPAASPRPPPGRRGRRPLQRLTVPLFAPRFSPAGASGTPPLQRLTVRISRRGTPRVLAPAAARSSRAGAGARRLCPPRVFPSPGGHAGPPLRGGQGVSASVAGYHGFPRHQSADWFLGMTDASAERFPFAKPTCHCEASAHTGCGNPYPPGRRGRRPLQDRR